MVEMISVISTFYQILQGIKCASPAYIPAISKKARTLYLYSFALHRCTPISLLLKDHEFYFNGFICGTSSENSSDQQTFVIAECMGPTCRNHVVNHVNISTQIVMV